jgi:hypothetical protein
MAPEAYLLDLTDREPVEHRPLKPIIIRGEEIEAEIARLAAGPRSCIPRWSTASA